MSEQELVEVLSVHADNLKDGVDLTPELLATPALKDDSVLESLMLLARRVKSALVPIEPRRDFVADLKAEIRVTARQERMAAARKEEDQRRMIWVAAGLGGLIYFISLTLVSLRLSLAVLSFIAGLLGWRSARPALRRTSAAH